jgi:hypothetical protein
MPDALTASSEGHYELVGNSSGDNLKTITQVGSAASSMLAASSSIVVGTPRDDWIDGNETDVVAHCNVRPRSSWHANLTPDC